MGTRDALDTWFSMAGGASYVKEEELMEEEEEDGGPVAAEKKRRLSVQQVRSLEKNFEVENKLEPQRKTQLAKELGLQPRQVAVWFQNRRARWKTKQLEKEFGLLKLNYDSLKASFDAMQRDNHRLAVELASLKRKWEDTGKQKADISAKASGEEENCNGVAAADSKHARVSEQQGGVVESVGVAVFNEALEGSESDNSAILNDHGAVAAGNNSPRPIDSYIRTASCVDQSTICVQPSDDNYTHDDPKSGGEGLMEALCCAKQGSNNNHIPSRPPGAGTAECNQEQYCFKADDNEESCSYFNVDDPAAATLTWWDINWA